MSFFYTLMGYYQKSHYPPTGYSGYVDELSNQLMKRAMPMRKFVGAEFGKLLFPTLPCMRNGSFIPSISIFKTKKQSRLIKWQEKK